MKIQFGTATLLVAIACVSIALGGGLAGWRVAMANDAGSTAPHLIGALAYLSPWWMPLAFAAYCLGQRRVTPIAAVGFAIAESVSVGGMMFVVKMFP